MESIKLVAKKILYIAAITIVLALCVMLTVIINKVIDGKLEQMDKDREKEALENALMASDVDTTGLNKYVEIWKYELSYLCENLPKDYPNFSDYIETDKWTEEINALIDKVSTEDISDENIFSKLMEIVPDRLKEDVYDNYLKAIFNLNPDLMAGVIK